MRFSTTVIEHAIAQAAILLASETLQRAVTSTNSSVISTAAAGKALSYPFYYSEWNLRPFDQLAAEAATTAGQICQSSITHASTSRMRKLILPTADLIIFTFFASPLWKQAFEPLRPKLTYSSQMILQLAVPILSYFWISFNYSLVTLAFKTDFRRLFGVGGWPLFWLNNWVCGCSDLRLYAA